MQHATYSVPGLPPRRPDEGEVLGAEYGVPGHFDQIDWDGEQPGALFGRQQGDFVGQIASGRPLEFPGQHSPAMWQSPLMLRNMFRILFRNNGGDYGRGQFGRGLQELRYVSRDG
jgi:hypothetical protein